MRLQRLIGWVCCTAALLCAAASATAQTVAPVVLSPGVQQITLTDRVAYMIDPSGEWRPGQPPVSEWKALAAHPGGGNFGASRDTIWLRSELRPEPGAEGDWLWVIPNPQLELVTLWIDTPGAPQVVLQGGLRALKDGTGHLARYPVMSLSLQTAQTHTIHVRVQSNALLLVPVELWRPNAWREQELRDHTFLGTYFGLVAGLLIYNGFLAFRLRDAAYGYYFAFGSGLALFQLANTGLGPLLLWREAALTTHLVLSVSTCLFGAMALTFTDRFLRLQTIAPLLSKIIRWSAWTWALVVLSHVHWAPGPVTNLFIVPLGVWTLSLVQWAGILGVRVGSPAARYFLLGWTGLVIACGIRVLLQLGWLPPHPLLYDAILIASAVEMLLLSLALADRIMIDRRALALADTQRERERVAREATQNALEDKSAFMAAVAHDLQQPMYALNLATESLGQQKHGPWAPALNQMRSALHAADDLLTSLAMAVRLERSALQPRMERFSMQALLERVDALFEGRAHTQGLQWRVPPCLSVVHSDAVLLERMVCNLVSNAMRYTERGGVLLACRLRGRWLLIQVWDTGRGIPIDEQAAVFDIHYRGQGVRQDTQGLGLGLSIVQRCANLLGVRLTMRSVTGRGSCFELWVPLATDTD